MQSIRSCLSTPLLAILLAGCQTTPTQLDILALGGVVDLSYPYNEQTIYWPTEKGFEKSTRYEGMTDKGYYYTAYSVETAEHGGTHLDAPIHFAAERHTTDAIPLEQLLGPAVVIDITAQVAQDRDYQLAIADLEAWEAQHGDIPAETILLVRTGYGKYWPDREAYLGTAALGEAAVAQLHFPGIGPEAAQWLVDQRGIKAVGIDTASIDHGQSTLFEAHRILLGANIPAFENVANLEALPATGAQVIALPMKIEGGSGAPLRIIALVPGDAGQ